MTTVMHSSATEAAAKRTIPMNVFRPSAPLRAVCLENRELVGLGGIGTVRHLVFDTSAGPYPFLEGQSAGILPPGCDANGKPHKVRLYSIASTRHGDTGDGKTLSLCVRRLEYPHPETGETVYGVCSSYLCGLKVGEEVNMTGPTGKPCFCQTTRRQPSSCWQRVRGLLLFERTCGGCSGKRTRTTNFAGLPG